MRLVVHLLPAIAEGCHCAEHSCWAEAGSTCKHAILAGFLSFGSVTPPSGLVTIARSKCPSSNRPKCVVAHSIRYILQCYAQFETTVHVIEDRIAKKNLVDLMHVRRSAA